MLKNLDFTPDTDAPRHTLSNPPDFRLMPPEAGWIVLHLEHPLLNDFPYVRLSNIFPPLNELWAWSLAVAVGLAPVRMPIDEEGPVLWLAAEPRGEDRLSLSLKRVAGWDSGLVLQHIGWEEPRAAFLKRWSTLFSAYFGDDTMPWQEWERYAEEILPEPARDFAWADIPQFLAPTPSPWPRAESISWFYLLLAHHRHEHTRRGCEPNASTFARERRAMRFTRLRVEAAAAAWSVFHTEPLAGLQAFERAYADARDQMENEESLDDETCPTGEERRVGDTEILHLIDDLTYTGFGILNQVGKALWSHFPIATGSFLMDEDGRRAQVLEVDGDVRCLYWSDGVLGCEYGLHIGTSALWRWPVAAGPAFNAGLLDPIEYRRLAFLREGVAPQGIVCPCCGYPDLECEDTEVQDCEICGWPVWRLLSSLPPALDATEDDDGGPISPTLREARLNFLSYGHYLPRDAMPEDEDDRYRLDWRRKPVVMKLRNELIADWETWIADPDRQSHPLPEPLWLRINHASSRGD